MLHILNEGGNSALIKRKVKAPLGKEIRKHLTNIFNNFEGDKGSKGYQRLYNILQMDKNEGGINYNELTQLNHIFSKLLPQSEEYQTLGGDFMKNWLEISEKSMENNDKADKQARKNAGEQNTFRKSHTKERGIKSKHKPSIGKFQTKNANKSIANNNFIKLVENSERKVIIISDEQTNYILENNRKNKIKINEKLS